MRPPPVNRKTQQKVTNKCHIKTTSVFQFAARLGVCFGPVSAGGCRTGFFGGCMLNRSPHTKPQRGGCLGLQRRPQEPLEGVPLASWAVGSGAWSSWVSGCLSPWSCGGARRLPGESVAPKWANPCEVGRVRPCRRSCRPVSQLANRGVGGSAGWQVGRGQAGVFVGSGQ